MGIDASKPKNKQNTGAIVWAVIGVVCLGTVLAVWLQKADSQPSSVFGSGGGVAILAVSLVAVIMASALRGAGLGFRRVLAVVTIVLALCTEVLALAHFSAAGGSADTAFGLILSVGAVAMLAASIGLLRGK